MSRPITWRRTCSDTVSWRQDQANNATIYILREFGPTGYLLKEEGVTRKFKVFLGDRHQCTCPVFIKEKDVCKHICWILLKKFRVPRDNPVTWQLGLVEREINEILRGILTRCEARPPSKVRHGTTSEEKSTGIEQRVISDGDVCPICQEDFLEKRQPVTYCRYGCGNSVHIRCMKVWADHQKSSGNAAAPIRCPMCRQDFGPISLLQQEFRNASGHRPPATANFLIDRPAEHLGVACRQCDVCPISGMCYKCATCVDYHLCERCFDCRSHAQHSFLFRKKISQRWRPVAGTPAPVVPPRGGDAILPTAVISDLMTRDIGHDDYEMLLHLDDPQSNQTSSSVLSASSVHALPRRIIRANDRLLRPGRQCRVCLRPYRTGEAVRTMPCIHSFHAGCIENWLLQQSPACPIDRTAYNDETCRLIREAARQRRQSAGDVGGVCSYEQSSAAPPSEISLEVPGIGLSQRRRGSAMSAPMARAMAGGRRGRIYGNRVAVAERPALGVNGSECRRIGGELFLLDESRIATAPLDSERTVAPSIPLPHNVTLADVLAQCHIHPLGGAVQQPDTSLATSQLSRGSMIKHTTPKRGSNNARLAGGIAQPTNDTESQPGESQLFVGNGAPACGLSVHRLGSSEVRGQAKRSTLTSRTAHELSELRWGATRDLDANEMMLAGTAVSDGVNPLKAPHR